MLKVLYGLKNFEGKSKFKTWLYSITYNECITQYRKERRKRRLMDALSIDPLEEASEEKAPKPEEKGGHKLGAGWQRMNGETSMPYLDGTNPYLVNYVQVNDFANAQERSWQLRYDYDFKAMGINGLSFMTRYVNGDNINVVGRSEEGKEWERDSELKYVVQSGTFKDLSVRFRNATYRTNYSKFARDVDETRLIVGYNLSIW